MRLCAACHVEIPDDRERCEDVARCRKRLNARVKEALGGMVTKPYVGGFDPVKAYRDSPKGL